VQGASRSCRDCYATINMIDCQGVREGNHTEGCQLLPSHAGCYMFSQLPLVDFTVGLYIRIFIFFIIDSG
jgi:hypothetical protein